MNDCPHCREIIEIYSGMDGVNPKPGVEQYLMMIIRNMAKEAMKHE
jgi:hypothetical protein